MLLTKHVLCMTSLALHGGGSAFHGTGSAAGEDVTQRAVEEDPKSERTAKKYLIASDEALHRWGSGSRMKQPGNSL